MLKKIFVCLLLILISSCSSGVATKNGKLLAEEGDSTPNLLNDHPSLDLLIFGGTSGVGLETVKLALGRGHQVTSIARRPERMALSHPNLLNLKGDITQIQTFRKLMNDKDAVISSIGITPTRKKITVYSEGIKNVIHAMTEYKIQRLITITGIGAGDSKGHGGFWYDKITNPLWLKTDYQDKTRQEEIIKKTNLDWTIVRPGFLTDKMPENKYRVIKDLEGITSGEISRADVAHFLISSVENHSYKKEILLLTN